MKKIDLNKKLAAAFAAVLLTLASQGAHADKAHDSIDLGFQLQLQSLDPYYSPGREGMLLGYMSYDALVYRDPNTLKIVPLLASSWQQVDDKTLDFKIRPNVKFQDGVVLTNKDVAGTLDFATNPDNHVFLQSISNWIASAQAIGTDTVRVTAKQVTPMALQFLAQLPIYEEAYRQRVGRTGMAQHPIGSGPFKAALGPDGTVVFTRYDGYFADSPKGRAQVKTLIYHVVPDSNTEVAELISGALDWAYYVPDEQATQLANFPNLKVAQGQSFRVAFITMDAAGKSGNNPLKDLHVRQAISYAIDRQAIVKNLMPGAQVIASMCDPKQFACEQEVTLYPHDLVKAKALMASSAYPKGFSIDIYAYRNRQVAEAIIGNLSQIGITANLRWVQYPAMVQKRRANQLAMVIDDWGSNSINDAAAIVPTFFDGGADDYAMDTAVTQDLARGDSSTDPKVRRATYSAALKRIASQAYVLPLFTMPVTYVMNADLDMPVPNDEVPQFWRAHWK